MALKDWKDLKPHEKTQKGMYELIKAEIDQKEKSKAKTKVEIKDEPKTSETAKKKE